LKIYISQDSVATQFRRGGKLQIFHRMWRWKKLWKSVNIWQRYGQSVWL